LPGLNPNQARMLRPFFRKRSQVRVCAVCFFTFVLARKPSHAENDCDRSRSACCEIDFYFRCSVLLPDLSTESLHRPQCRLHFGYSNYDEHLAECAECVKKSASEFRWIWRHHVCSFNTNYKNTVKFCRSLLNNK
jgi:hypothetical protein